MPLFHYKYIHLRNTNTQTTVIGWYLDVDKIFENIANVSWFCMNTCAYIYEIRQYRAIVYVCLCTSIQCSFEGHLETWIELNKKKQRFSYGIYMCVDYFVDVVAKAASLRASSAAMLFKNFPFSRLLRRNWTVTLCNIFLLIALKHNRYSVILLGLLITFFF